MRLMGIDESIKLSSNENPFGAGKLAIAAGKEAAGDLHLYPDGASRRLKEALARSSASMPRQIAVGCGSDELIRMLGEAYLEPKRRRGLRRCHLQPVCVCHSPHGRRRSGRSTEGRRPRPLGDGLPGAQAPGPALFRLQSEQPDRHLRQRCRGPALSRRDSRGYRWSSLMRRTSSTSTRPIFRTCWVDQRGAARRLATHLLKDPRPRGAAGGICDRAARRRLRPRTGAASVQRQPGGAGGGVRRPRRRRARRDESERQREGAAP